MNKAAAGKWAAYSAGSHPAGEPNPVALQTLRENNIPVNNQGNAPYSKSWNEFTSDDAPIMDVVVTVCDNAAGETCPIWPTHSSKAPQKYHWSFPDPASALGTDEERRAVFQQVFISIRNTINTFLNEQA